MNDETQAPNQPQYTLGATANEAKLSTQIARNSIPGPGGIVDRLGQQFTLPRAATDSEVSRDTHGLPNG